MKDAITYVEESSWTLGGAGEDIVNRGEGRGVGVVGE